MTTTRGASAAGAVAVPNRLAGRRAGPARLETVAGGLAGLVAAAAYSSFLLEKALGSPLNPAHAYVSELDVPGQPASTFFRLSDILAGALLMLFAWALSRCLPADWRRRAGCLAIVLMGASSIVDGTRPLPCTPSTEAACALRDRTDPLAQLHQTHVLSSITGIAAAVVGMVLLGSLLYELPGCRRLGSLGVGGAFLVTGLAALEITLMLRPGLWVGLPERAETLLVSLWYGAVSWRVLADRPGWLSRADARQC